MAPDREPTEARLNSAMHVMIVQLSLGQENTAKATADYNQLEQDYVSEMGLAGDDMLLPRHVRETFLGFLTWCFREAGRARSMKAMWRHLPGIFKTWSLTPFMEEYAVRKHYRELADQWSEEPEQAVPCTERMALLLQTDD